MFEMLVDRNRSERWIGEPTDRGVGRSLITSVTEIPDVLTAVSLNGHGIRRCWVHGWSCNHLVGRFSSLARWFSPRAACRPRPPTTMGMPPTDPRNRRLRPPPSRPRPPTRSDDDRGADDHACGDQRPKRHDHAGVHHHGATTNPQGGTTTSTSISSTSSTTTTQPRGTTTTAVPTSRRCSSANTLASRVTMSGCRPGRIRSP